MRLNERAAAAATEALPERNAIIVLGMHRSGTSALTRVISLLGAELPKRVMGPHASNERGHWEPDQLVALHDRLLREIGSRWDDWRSWDTFPIGEDRLAHYRTEIRSILEEEYDEARLFVLKDPRICRFVPLYDAILSEMGAAVSYVIPVRNPLAVIASLRQRDGMTDGFVALLWLRHVLDAEYATRGKSRFFTSYEELIADWRGVVGKMGSALSFGWPIPVETASESIGDHLSSDLQHHVFNEEDIARVGNFGAWLKDTYTALLNLCRSHDESNFIILDRVRRSFDGFVAQAGAVMFPELGQRETRLWAEINSQRERADAEQGRAAHVQQLLDMEGQRAEAERQRADAEQGRAAHAQQLLDMASHRAEAERQRADAEQGRAAHAQQLLDMQSQYAEAERQRADMEAQAAASAREALENERGDRLKIAEERTALAAEAEMLRSRLLGVAEGLEAERRRADAEARAAASAREALENERGDRLKIAEERNALAAEAGVLRSRLDEAAEGLEAVRLELEASRQEVAALRSSTSWRITAPLRAIKSRLS